MSELLFVNRNCVVCIIYYHIIEDGRNAMKSLLLSQSFYYSSPTRLDALLLLP